MLLTAALVAAASIFVVDGDTIKIGEDTIRVANIDAPETHAAKCDAERRLGIVAKRRVEDLLKGDITITVGDPKDGRKRDRHGRTLATISVEGRDIGEILIEEGLARPWEGKRRSWCESLD